MTLNDDTEQCYERCVFCDEFDYFPIDGPYIHDRCYDEISELRELDIIQDGLITLPSDYR